MLPGVALVIGAADRSRVAELIDHLEDGPPLVAVSPIATAKSFLDVPITEMTEHSRAFVKVQEGCNESCTFCIVPQTRGVSRSRAPASVLDQVRHLPTPGMSRWCSPVYISATTGSISPRDGECCPS